MNALPNQTLKKNKYDLSGNYGIGWTFKDEEFYFDLEDYDKIKNYCWSTRHGYLRARNPKTNKDIIMHRLIMNITDPKLMVDHIKHNKLDNRKQFLRVCTNKENSRNKELVKWNTSGVIGVSYNEKTKLWRSHIMVDRKTINLGTFDNIDDAIDARQKAEDLYFGEYSYRASMNHI